MGIASRLIDWPQLDWGSIPERTTDFLPTVWNAMGIERCFCGGNWPKHEGKRPMSKFRMLLHIYSWHDGNLAPCFKLFALMAYFSTLKMDTARDSTYSRLPVHCVREGSTTLFTKMKRLFLDICQLYSRQYEFQLCITCISKCPYEVENRVL